MAFACEVGECLRVHLNDVVRFLESGNHDCDTLDYAIFRLDWVLNVLARYLDTEGTGAINARVIDLVCEAREAVINADHSRGAFQAGCIFTGQPGVKCSSRTITISHRTSLFGSQKTVT